MVTNDSLILLCQLRMTAIAHPDLLCYPKMRERHGLGRAGLIEDPSAVATVMLAVGEREGRSTSQAYIRVDPFGCSLRVDHGCACQD